MSGRRNWGSRLAAFLLLLAGAVLLSACIAKNNLVVVIPAEGDGHVGAVVVHDQQGGSITLNRAYAGVASGTEAHALIQPVELSRKSLVEIFHEALRAEPNDPRSYILYFVSDADELTPESRAVFDRAFGLIHRRPVVEIVVTGHTDTVASSEYNDRLSLQRAETVRKMLIERGIPADSITAIGRGKREPLVPTPDQTSEPRNRRVVLTVR